MKKILWILVTGYWLLATGCWMLDTGNCFAQGKKGKIEGVIYLAKNQAIKMNAPVIAYLMANLSNIESIGGQTTFIVPIEREYKKSVKSRLVDGYLVQYIYNPVSTSASVQNIKTKVIEFDFQKKTISKEKNQNDDKNCFDRPSDTKLKQEVEKKEKAKQKPQAIKPGK